MTNFLWTWLVIACAVLGVTAAAAVLGVVGWLCAYHPLIGYPLAFFAFTGGLATGLHFAD